MLFRRIIDPPSERRSWAAWLLSVGLTLLLLLTIGLQAGTLRVEALGSGIASPSAPAHEERITFQTMPTPATSARRAAPTAPRRTAPHAQSTERRPAQAPPAPPVRSRAVPDSGSGVADTQHPPTSIPTGIMPPAMRLTLPATPTPRGTNAAPPCTAPCVAGVRAGVSAPQHTLTAAERDSVLQAISSAIPAEAAAAGGGGSKNTGGMGGISIPVGLPGGGPSRAQRKRDSTINANTLPILERLKQRADSVLAARRRDSLEAIAKQKRDSTQQRDSTEQRDSTSGVRRRR